MQRTKNSGGKIAPDFNKNFDNEKSWQKQVTTLPATLKDSNQTLTLA